MLGDGACGLAERAEDSPHIRSTRPIDLMTRLAASTLLVWSALALYFVIVFNQPASYTAVVMPSWVPFWPVFAAPYLSLLLIAWLLPVMIRERQFFVACLIAMAVAYFVVVPWWLMMPTRMDRPAMPAGWWVEPYRWIASVDPPRCVMPCGHGLGPTVAAWYVAIDRPAWRWPLVAMLVLTLPSIAFIGQHRPVDILLGQVAAVVGIAAAELWRHRNWMRPFGSEAAI